MAFSTSRTSNLQSLALDGKKTDAPVRHHLAYLQAGYKTQDWYKVGLQGTRGGLLYLSQGLAG